MRPGAIGSAAPASSAIDLLTGDSTCVLTAEALPGQGGDPGGRDEYGDPQSATTDP